MNLLAIETSSDYLSLAAGRGAAIQVFHERVGQRQAEMILDEIPRLLARAGTALSELQGIAYGKGPGSFTGVRIACGVTQGLAYALGIPVKGVVTLEALAEECRLACGAERIIACIDARMGEVYHAAYRREAGEWIEVSPPALHAPGQVPRISGDGHGWTGCGSGFAAYAEAMAARYPHLDETRADHVPSARAALLLTQSSFAAGKVDAARDALPLYVRDKVALTKNEQR
jgi:tRNA threonylcarbamoyladenosine biosynthesis protein TsaB